jgi:hypothetical protein
MHYRDHYITPTRDGLRWQVSDADGRFVVSRPSQEACAAWVDKFHAYLEAKRHELPRSDTTQSLRQRWRARRDSGPLGD